jgi:hypothetical protein
MFAKVLTRPVEASLHRSDASRKNFGNFGMAPAFLDQSKQRAILRAKLGEGVTESIKFLCIDRSGRFRNIFVLFSEGQEDTAKFLATELIDARVTSQTEQPRFELRRLMKTVDGPNHFDEDLLGQILDVIGA